MGTIDRIRYYDGEFLRASDFGDEQTYHLEMRRRINRYLHLYGIVEGLQLQNDNQTGVNQVSILKGMAIDALGREIYVFQPHTLGDTDVNNNRITQPGTYDVWLRYNKTASAPPSAGYSSCNQMNQYTRWGESFSVVLLLSPSNPFTLPGFAVDDSDDPSQDQVGVLLGTVKVDPTSATGTFYGALFDYNRCKLLGIIAQRIHTPPYWDATKANPPFSFLNANPAGVANTPLSPSASLEIKPNIFADQNLIVGPDFPLSPPPPSGPPNVQIMPNPTVSDPGAGSVKIAGDLFVQGNIYSLITSAWTLPSAPSPPFPPAAGTTLALEIGAYAQQLLQSGMPEFIATQPQTVTVPNPTTSASPMLVTVPFPIPTTRVKSSNNVIASAAISGIQFNTGVTFGSIVGVFLTNVSASVANSSCNFSVTYTVTGGFGNNAQPPILFFYLTLMAVAFP